MQERVGPSDVGRHRMLLIFGDASGMLETMPALVLDHHVAHLVTYFDDCPVLQCFVC